MSDNYLRSGKKTVELKQIADQDGVVSDEKKSRRKVLLASVAAAGAASLPTEWKRPVVDAVLLPAHAQMSPMSATDSSSTSEAVEELTCTNGIIQLFSNGNFAVVATGPTTSTFQVTIYDRTVSQYDYTSCEDSMGNTSSTTMFSFSQESLSQTSNGNPPTSPFVSSFSSFTDSADT